MWDTLVVLPFGRLSKRNFFSGAAAILLAVFATLTLASQPTSAAPDATWNQQGQLVYGTDTYAGPSGSASAPAVPEDAVESYISTTSATAAKIIYFPKGTDPKTATSALYVEATVSGNTYTPKSSPRTISLAAQNAANAPPTGDAQTCEIASIGWIVCPVSNFIAIGIDGLYAMLSTFLNVKPLLAGDNALFRLWEVMRNFANITFIIAFLIIIYSHLAGGGLSNYNMKRMMPRLVIAAILVNVSYWICAAAVDLSNVLGYSIQHLFEGLRDYGEDGVNQNKNLSWEGLTTFILSGGAVGAIAGVAATGGSILSAVFFLISALITVLFAIVVAVLILAARQAAIVILIIIAPLAFVAFILPNTEKWFDRWRNTLSTLLIMFPIFSVIFGGSQLAGQAIIQNSDSVVMMILGMAVQVAPLVITPMLVKFSGGVVGQIANMTNNKSKGIVDRSKNAMREQAGYHKDKALASDPRFRKISPRVLAQRMDNRKRTQEMRRKNFQTGSELRHMGTEGYESAHTDSHDLDVAKKRIEGQHEIHLNARLDPKDVHFNRAALNQELEMRYAAEKAGVGKNKMDSLYTEAKAGDRSSAPRFIGPQTAEQASNDIYNRLENLSTKELLESNRKRQAEREMSSHANKTLLGNAALQDYAAGIGDAELMLAGVVSKDRQEYGENVAAQQQLMKHFKLESNDYQTIAMNRGDVVRRDSSGNEHVFKFSNEFSKEAAIENQYVAGSYGQKMEIANESGREVYDMDDTGRITVRAGVNYEHRSTIQEAIIKSGFSAQAPFVNDKSYDQILKGEWKGKPSMSAHSIRQIMEGRVKADGIVRGNENALKVMFELGDLKQSGDANDQRKFDEYKRMFLEGIEDRAARTQTAATFDEVFDQNYTDLQKEARQILETPLLVKDANREARAVFKQYAQRVGYVEPET